MAAIIVAFLVTEIARGNVLQYNSFLEQKYGKAEVFNTRKATRPKYVKSKIKQIFLSKSHANLVNL